jgi:hypothetical protein
VRPESLELDPAAPEEVLARMATMAERLAGWVNLEPLLEGEEAELPVPLCTWSPGERRRRRTTPPVVGVQHHVRRKVAELVAVPDRWVVVQDNARRGLVVHVPPDEPHERVLRWMLDAGTTLTPVPVRRWAAHVYAVVG